MDEKAPDGMDPAEELDRLARESYKEAVDRAFEAQKSGIRLSRRFFENWVETLEDHAELNRHDAGPHPAGAGAARGLPGALARVTRRLRRLRGFALHLLRRGC